MALEDTDRLYATPDELLFNPDRSLNHASLTAAALARRDFFLTAQSRAPETTLLNTPRISLWQTMQSPTQQTARDRLLNFCATQGGKSYFFQKEQVAPGFGAPAASGSARSVDRDMVAIVRNQELHTYLSDQLMAAQIPGFSGSFSTKWSGAGCRQMATATVDYFRSNTNTYYKVGGGGRTWSYELPTSSAAQGGYVMPLRYAGGAGLGRSFAFVTEAAVAFVATKSDANRATTEYQKVLLFNLYTPCPHAGSAAPAVRIQASGLGFNGTIVQKNRMGSGSDGGRNFPFPGAHTQLYKADTDASPRTFGTSNVWTEFPFVQTVAVPSGTSSITFSGGQLVVTIQEPDAPSGTPLQTLTFNFDAETLTVPQATDVNGIIQKNYSNTYLGRGNINRLFLPGDIVRSVRFRSDAAAPHKGDLRLLALKRDAVPEDWFIKHPQNGQPVTAYTFDASGNPTNTAAARANRLAHSLRSDFKIHNGNTYGYADGKNGVVNVTSGPQGPSLGTGWDQALSGDNKILAGGLVANLRIGSNTTNNRNYVPAIPQGLAAALNASNQPGDFTTTYGFCLDGATVAVPDFGTFYEGSGGYYTEMNWGDAQADSFEPNRQVPSAVILGTLPAPDSTGNPAPWQTLLFCPNSVSAAGAAGNVHPGSQGLPDHLFLDFFWMPAVDPYALSEPLSTAGKVNLNYQLAPFTHITRATAVVAALKPVRMAAIEDVNAGNYKQVFNPGGTGTAPKTFTTRHLLNSSSTTGSLADFKTRFEAGDIFRSASEVCTIRLVPAGETLTSLNTWWGARRLTGDNLREAPYKALYSRVTTKSNTFTVHYRVQALKQVNRGGRDWAKWEEAKDVIAGEYRGATTIERFLDPNAPNLPDYATVSLTGAYDPIDRWYRWRVLSEKQFAP